MNPIAVTADAETFTCNAYLVTEEPVTLVDAGTMAGVEDVIADHVADVDRVVVTHQHGDHVGELAAVLDAFDADLYAYADHPRRTHQLADGEQIRIGNDEYEVVHTPGHADDHVALLGAEAIFSGDVVVYNDGAFDNGSFGRTDYPGQSREELIESIRRILDRLPDSTAAMYAGHGDRIETDPDELRGVIERALHRAERREPKYPDD